MTEVFGFIPVEVLGPLISEHMHVVVGIGIGMLDGGIPQEWPLEWIPPDLRIPNTIFWLATDSKGNWLGIKKTDGDAEDYFWRFVNT